MEVAITPAFQMTFPNGLFGMLVATNCTNRPKALHIHGDVESVEARLRRRFPSGELDGDPVAQAYAAYFRNHRNRYPVVHQAKSTLAGRPLESPSALVEIMFTAEVESLVLTSGHDLRTLNGRLLVDVAQLDETYMKLNGKEQLPTPGDMLVRDADGIIACVVYGPDSRTRIRSETNSVLFGAWCPVDVPMAVVNAHLETLGALLQREWPDARVESSQVFRSSPDT